MTQPTVGIAGTGRMGTAFARRLIECGFPVTVWNRTRERMVESVSAGATTADDLSALAACEVILLSLTDGPAVEAVVGELIRQGIRGRLVVDTSTMPPETSASLAEQVAQAGADFVDCPVGGTVAPALKGQLLGFAGGTEAAVARARPVMEALCRRVEHVGPAGSGALVKLAVNLPLALYWQVLGESLALLRGNGIPAETVVSLIADSSAGPAVLKNRADAVVRTLGGEDQPGTFDIAGLAKDLALAVDLAARKGRNLPLAGVAQRSYAAALDAGLGRFEGASLSRRVAEGPQS